MRKLQVLGLVALGFFAAAISKAEVCNDEWLDQLTVATTKPQSSAQLPTLDQLLQLKAAIQNDEALGWGVNAPAKEAAYASQIAPHVIERLEIDLQRASSPSQIIAFLRSVERLAYFADPIRKPVRQWLSQRNFDLEFSALEWPAGSVEEVLAAFTKLDRLSYPNTDFTSQMTQYFEWLKNPQKIREQILSPPAELYTLQTDVDKDRARGFAVFNASLSGLLRRLSEAERTQLNQLIQSESARRRALQTQYENETGATPKRWQELWHLKIRNKVQIRNLEFYHYQLNLPNVLTLIQSLRSAPTDLSKAIDRYFAQVREFNPETPAYSFKKVKEIADAVQKHLGILLESDDYIEIFGSFTNGKARSESDIDVGLSPSFLTRYESVFGKERPTQPNIGGPPIESESLPPSANYYRTKWDTAAPPEQQEKFVTAFGEVEPQLARLLDRSQYEPSKLFAISAAASSLTKLEFPAQGITIRIYNDRLVLRVHVAVPGKRGVEEFLIP